MDEEVIDLLQELVRTGNALDASLYCGSGASWSEFQKALDKAGDLLKDLNDVDRIIQLAIEARYNGQ